MAKRPHHLHLENTVSLELEPLERKLLLDLCILPPQLEKRIRIAPVKSASPRFLFTVDELEKLWDCIAAEADHNGSTNIIQQLEVILDRLDSLLTAAELERGEYPELLDSIMNDMKGRTFKNKEEAEWVVDAKFSEYNNTPQEEMGGLSPFQVGFLIESDWDDPKGAIRFNEKLPHEQLQNVRHYHNSRMMLSSIIEEGGISLTQGGNLNRKFVKKMLDSLDIPEWERTMILLGCKVFNEEDVRDVRVCRALLKEAGLVRKHYKLLKSTEKGKKLIDKIKSGKIFSYLFKSCFRKLNIISLKPLKKNISYQDDIAYPIYQVGKLSHEWVRPQDVMNDIFLPYVKEQVPPPSDFLNPIEYLAEKLALEPLADFGLLERRELSESDKFLPKYEYRKSFLFDEFLAFNLECHPTVG